MHKILDNTRTFLSTVLCNKINLSRVF